MQFVPGLQLSRRFFHDCVEPQLARLAPGLAYGAALIGEGSEVLGYDTEISTDHDWGPRVQIFVKTEDFVPAASMIVPVLQGLLPSHFLGRPVAFAHRRRPHGVDVEAQAAGAADHGVEFHVLTAWARRTLGIGIDGGAALSLLDWLSLPDPVLLSTTRGDVFRDDRGELTALRERLAYYPRDVWLYKLASQWMRISEEIAFVGRSGDAGDDLGSRLIAGRLVHDAMRVAFLMERQYAPYSKWFGRAFADLACAGALGPQLASVLDAGDWQAREAALMRALLSTASLHATLGLPGDVSPRIGPYFERPYQVVNAADIAATIFAAIDDQAVAALPRTGAVDQVVDNTAVLTSAARRRAVAAALFNAR